ncbi:MAG: hypothetical protein ACYCO5_06810 [Acidobacteriaceae bacterium]
MKDYTGQLKDYAGQLKDYAACFLRQVLWLLRYEVETSSIFGSATTFLERNENLSPQLRAI